MTEPLLVLDHVGVVLGGARVLDEVSLTIMPGERVAITGESGAGKSVLVALAAGLIRPTAGHVWLMGEHLGTATPGALRRLRAACGIALQGGSLLGALSVEDNLRLAVSGGGLRPSQRAKRRIDRLLVDFRAEHLAPLAAASLSAGEHRRVELARAFVRDPALVIVDEPFAGAAAVAEVLENQLARHVIGRARALLLLTQDVTLAGRLAQRVCQLDNFGRLQQLTVAKAPAAAS